MSKTSCQPRLDGDFLQQNAFFGLFDIHRFSRTFVPTSKLIPSKEKESVLNLKTLSHLYLYHKSIQSNAPSLEKTRTPNHVTAVC